jgi:TPR repeat protein
MVAVVSLGACTQPSSGSYVHSDKPATPAVAGNLAERARMGDNAAAMILAGALYRAGNPTEAFNWTKLAADRGWADAQAGLGKLYTFGTGVPQDYSLALKYCRMSAEQNNAAGLNNLAYLYERGLGVSVDPVQARAYYRRSALQGDVFAQSSLGRFNEEGIGGPMNLELAYFWDSLAASKLTGTSLVNAVQRREAVANRLSADTVAALQKSASVWKPGTEPPTGKVVTVPGHAARSHT